MKAQKPAVSGVIASSDSEKNRRLFLKPVKKIVIDIGVFFLINSIMIYCLLFLTTDTTVGMIGSVWVIIIAWRGGILAGLLSSFLICISSTISIGLPPHTTIPVTYYFNNRVPGEVFGLLQSLIGGLIAGYISTLFHQLRDEVALRKKTQKNLEQKISELDAFGHMVAHDLKNPLSVICISIESLVNDFSSAGNEKTNRKLRYINDGTKHMISIIESILLLAGLKKIDRSEFEIFSISECIDEALKRMEYNIESNGVKVSKPDSWPLIFGYAPWITEVWVNYISNAVKYGGNPSLGKRPFIELGYDKPENSRHIRFWVKDNGEGIAKDKESTLFKEFTRLHIGNKEGHGLGLSIVKTIIDKFNGAVGVESELGKGSLFYFTLPENKLEMI